MMRSLWTSASGMSAQMVKMDTVTNNMANVNTTGFKRERVEFKSLLYETMQRADLDPANQTGRPVNLQVGHGVRAAATSRMFTQGALQRSDRSMDFAIEGNGFFEIRRSEDEYFFTRDGTFHLMPLDDGTLMLTTSQGFPVMDTERSTIIVQQGFTANDITASDLGVLFAQNHDPNEEEFLTALDHQIRIVQFQNPNGLEAIGGNLFMATVAAGEMMNEWEDGATNSRSRLVQGYLEMSNVQIAEEMIGLITAQRAFDTNSRGITTSDEMLQQANNLKR